ncbi:MAG: major capsid protein [Fibromonadaceae bacterium]|jgi:hypothetical protein|nr:major capsid protein [Fibromonadaceae bacterium]
MQSLKKTSTDLVTDVKNFGFSKVVASRVLCFKAFALCLFLMASSAFADVTELESAVTTELGGIKTALFAIGAVLVAIYAVPAVIRFIRGLIR